MNQTQLFLHRQLTAPFPEQNPVGTQMMLDQNNEFLTHSKL